MRRPVVKKNLAIGGDNLRLAATVPQRLTAGAGRGARSIVAGTANMAEPTVSVIIPTTGRRALLPSVVAPLLADRATREVVVVVDGDRDGSLEVLHDLARADARLRPLAIPNQGASVARAVGVRHATGEVVVLLDDDVVASPGLITGHARHHAAARGLVVQGYMPIDLAAVPRPERFAALLYSEAYEARCVAYEQGQGAVLRNLWAGNISLRRDDCLAVGLADERFTGGFHADQDYGLRCLEAGLVGVFDRSLHARHLYRRGLDGFIADARSQGVTLLHLHERHRDVIGDLDVDRYFLREVPTPIRQLVSACRRPRARRAAVALLSTAIRMCGVAGFVRAQVVAARVLRRIEQQHGARSARRRTLPAQAA